ncbi:MAG: HEAT repeat domain-containing protein [Thermoflexales bacterium]|nr:HEAT repeat domain-containing protein [Thermoflexales bacterium]
MFKFDPSSFVIGLIVGWLIAFVLYRQRAGLQRLAAGGRERVNQLLNSLTANIESRYLAALRVHLDQLMVTHSHATFDQLYVTQRLAAPPARPTLAPPDPHAPTTLGLSAAMRSTTRLAVLGESGSGRTTLINKLARIYADHQAVTALGVEGERLPIVLHLAEVDWVSVVDSDPLPGLMLAATAYVPRLITANVSKLIRTRLKSGSAVFLLDGFDEVAPGWRPRAAQSLAALAAQFPAVPIVVTAGPLGYGALQNAGFAPLTLATWSAAEIDRYAQNWVTLISGGQQDRQVLATGLRQYDEVAPGPIDLALAAVVWRTRSALPSDRAALYAQWLDLALRSQKAKDPLSADKAQAALGKLAWTAYQEARFDLPFDSITQAINSLMPVGATPDEAARLTEHAATIAHDLLDHTGLLVPFGLDGWTFAHRRLAAYLAAWHAVQSALNLTAQLDQPQWADVLDFYAALTNPEPLITHALATADDLSRTHLWAAAHWTGYAPADAPWRSRVLGEVARAWLQPEQFGRARDRAFDSLIATRDKGLAFMFKRSLAHTDPQVRALSLRGLARLGRETDLPVFSAALADTAPEVRLEAIRGLGFIASHGSNPATEQLIKLVLEQDEDGRRLAAELLADCGDEGHQILREAIGEEDIQVRRAAAYGLAATGQDWARDLLRKLEHDDKQWFVRSAATDALSLMQAHVRPATEEPAIDLTPLVIDQQGWLVEWAAQQGLGIGVGRQANAAMFRAMTEGPAPVRLAALQTLRHTGDLSHHDQLRALLYDPDRAVREAAFAALEAIGQRTGQPLPR